MLQFIYRIAVIATIFSLIGCVAQQPTSGNRYSTEQIRLLMSQVSIPQWERAGKEINNIRWNPSTDNVAAEKWRRLDAAVDVKSGKSPLSAVTNARNTKEMQLYATWLRWRILAQNDDGRYSYVYALNLHRMRAVDGDYAKEAAVFLYNARLALAIDGARCADPTSAQSIMTGYEDLTFMQPLIEKVEKMSEREKGFAILEAVSIEEARGARPAYEWLCNRGIDAMLRAVDAGRQPKQVTTPDSQVIGNSYQIDTTGITASFVADELWQKKRRAILDKTISEAAKHL